MSEIVETKEETQQEPISGVVEVMQKRQRWFTHLTEALDFCTITQPQHLAINIVQQGDGSKAYLLEYTGSAGQL